MLAAYDSERGDDTGPRTGRMARVLGRLSAPRSRFTLVVIVGLSMAATIGAMRHTSTTFDEIVMVAGGARGYHTGRFDLVPEHPPLMQYVYGLPVFLLSPHYPSEDARQWGPRYSYDYARQFFFGGGNDPQRVAFVARLMAAALAVCLVLAVFSFARKHFDDRVALLAAAVTAFMPDVLAHGGVAWNDLPTALGCFCAVWAVDAVVRRPGAWRGALAGGAMALAIATKFSAIVLLPIAACLLVAELIAGGVDRVRLRRLLVAADVALLVGYLTLVLVYRGDASLTQLRAGLFFQIVHASRNSHDPVAFLGHRHLGGSWYFFPLAFFLKTPVAFHAMLAVSAIALLRGAKPGRSTFASPLRAPVLAAGVLLLFLLRARLDIGFRYALPLLPFLAVIAAVGVMRAWDRAAASSRPRLARALLAFLPLAFVATSLSFYPEFLAFTSAYIPRSAASRVLVDSNLDWGQGLLALRDFMKREGVQRIYLSYFGSAPPEGYGIHYLPLGRLLRQPSDNDLPKPRLSVVSATYLAGAYLPADPFAPLRALRPYRIIGGSLYVYRTADVLRALRATSLKPERPMQAASASSAPRPRR
jgi:4-amino-4-deoxy-L-arabinose transferase-like glycosyltransferase